MKSFTTTATALAVLLPVISAHTRFTTLFINNQSQGDGTCIRMDPDPSTTTGFISGLDSPDMACGVGGSTPVNRTCTAAAGDSISLLHRSWADGAQPGSIDPSHKGSTAVYLKKMGGTDATNPFSTDAAGDGWAKIAYDGFSDGSWGTEKMIASDGIVSSTIPSDLAPGYYLLRSEVLAMQNVVDGDPPKVNPQFYAGCAQVYIDGTGSGEPSDTASIPGYVDESTPAMGYNIYKQFPPAQPFEEFGPAVYESGSGSGTGSGTGEAPSSSDSIVGACPADTVLEVANMCMTEIPSWSDDTPGYLTKCWAASQSCWDTLTYCWDNVSPAVNGRDQNSGCSLWNTKCQGIVDWCEGGNLEGPPKAGEVLTPPQASLRKREGVARALRDGKRSARRTVEARGTTAKMLALLA